MHNNGKLSVLLFVIAAFYNQKAFSQTPFADSNRIIKTDTVNIAPIKDEQRYKLSNGKILVYRKPKPFGFITSLPQDAKGIVVTTFRRESIKPLLFIGGTTAVLMLGDQWISNGVRQFAKNIHFHKDQEYRDIINIKAGKTDISILKTPKNLNTALYQMGQGFPSILIGAGLYTFGKINNDYRALSTAGQLTETFILMGVGTQLLKRITGRQSPSDDANADGDWHFFPSFKNYQNHTPDFDAFPSGHLATLMSSVTILAENYPEKRYIKPVGYTLTGLVGLAMINNNVHWASDYPLAIGLGYLCAKQVVKTNRKIVGSTSSKKNKPEMSYTFNYTNGKLMPRIICNF